MGSGLGIDKHVPPVQPRYEDVPVSIVVNIVSRSKEKHRDCRKQADKEQKNGSSAHDAVMGSIELAIAIDTVF